MKKIDKYFSKQQKHGDCDTLYFLSNWGATFAVSKYRLSSLTSSLEKKYIQNHAVRALKDLKSKINEAIAEIKND